MDNAQGKKIYYGIVLDNAQLRQDAEQSKNIFRGIGDASTASASRIDSAYKSVSGTLMKLGAAVSAVELAKGIYNFADRFERSMAEVTTISETVTNDLGKFKQEIIEMSTEIPVPADEAAKALYQIVSAGHDGAAGLEVLRVSAKAAVGGVTETVTAADAITSILNAYKKGAGEAENISDQLFTTVRLGKTTMGELGHSISQAIPIAASFGIESEQVLAAIATLTKSGTPTAQAVTQVRAAVKAASEQLGDGYFKTHTFQQGLQEIAKKAGGSEAKLRALVPEIEAMNGILGLTGINAKTAASDLEELMNSAGATEAAFQKMASETSSQLTILKNNVLAEFSELGESMVENVGKVAAALNEAFDTGKIDEMLSVLGTLIAMYGTYKATLIATAAIRESVETVKHTEEAAELYKLLAAEQQAQISKKGLAKTSAEYYAMVKAETAASVQAAQSALTKARADVTASNQAVAARRAEYIAAKQLEAQRLTELTAISTTGTAKQTEAAQRKLAAAETQRESAAIAFQSATRDFNTKKTAVETAARTANTTATAVNTAAQTANATATGFLTVAKTRLAAVAARLNAVIMANPYALAAAAAVAFGYGLYKLITYQTEAEKAQKRFNEATEEFEKSSTSEIAVLNIMFSRLNKAKEGTDEYRAAKEAIQKKYGDYLSKMGDEVRLLKDTTLAQKELTTAILETARARAQEKFIQQESDAASEKQVAALRQIREKLIKEKGENVGEAIYGQIKSMLVAYQNDPQDRDGKKYTEYVKLLRENGLGDDIGYGRLFTSAYGEYVNSVQRLLKAQQDADAYFGAPQSNEEDQTTFDATTTSLQQLMTRLPKVREELAALKNAEKPDAAAIAAKEQEIKQIKDQTEARERELSVIKDVKAQIEALQKQQLDYGKDDEEYKSLEARIKYLKTKLPLTDGQIGKTVSRQSKYDEQIRQEAIQRQRAEEDLEFSVQQARIDAMKDGIDKVLAQNELNHKRELSDIERQKQDLLKAIQDQERTIWEAKNPDWEKKGLKFTPKTTELPQDVTELFMAMTTASNAKSVKTNQQALDDMLADFLTYEQSRTKITEEYEKKRKALYEADGKTLKKGVTQGNVDELNRNETEALTAVDEQFAQREETYQAWMNAIGNMTLRQLQQILQQAEQELEALEKSGTADDKQLSVARSKVTAARKKVKQANAENEVSPGKRSIKEWEDLYKTLQEAEREFESIGDAVGGAAGEIIGTAGTVLTSTLSMINGIVTLTTASTTGMQTAALASATAIQTVEKASVILTIISAALSIATAIIGLFNNDEKYQEEIEKLQGRIDQLQWELDNADVVRLQNNTENALGRVKRIYNETAQEVLSLHATTNRYASMMYQFFGQAIYKSEILRKSTEKLAVEYANIKYSADKALGSAKYDEAKDKLRNIAEQQLLIQEQIKKEDAKKKTDHGKIVDWERQIQELGAEAVAIINDLVEDIIGGSAADIAKELGDAFIDAFQAGEDAAEAWRDKVNEVVADVIRRMLIQRFLEEPLGDVFDKYKEKWFKEGNFAGIDEIIASMGGFASDLNSVGDDFKEIWDNLPDSVKNMFTITGDATREASEKGIATASQESVDELNGRATAMQGHTYSIMESAKLLVANSSLILMHLAGIETNTKQLARLEHIESDMSSIKSTVSDMALKGLKMKK